MKDWAYDLVFKKFQVFLVFVYALFVAFGYYAMVLGRYSILGSIQNWNLNSTQIGGTKWWC